MVEDSSSEFKVKNYTLYSLLVLDLIFNGMIESEEKKGIALGLIGGQVFFRLVSFFVLFLVVSGTFVFRYGLIGVLYDRFKWTFAVALLGFLVTLGFRAYRVIMVLNNKDAVTIWDDDLYQALYFIHNFVTLGFYAITVRTCQDLGDPHLYKPSSWLS